MIRSVFIGIGTVALASAATAAAASGSAKPREGAHKGSVQSAAPLEQRIREAKAKAHANIDSWTALLAETDNQAPAPPPGSPPRPARRGASPK